MARARSASRTRRIASSWTLASAKAIAAGDGAGPPIRRASRAASAASSGRFDTGRLSPWRSALREDRALPSAVRGPVLRPGFLSLRGRTSEIRAIVSSRGFRPHFVGRINERCRLAPEPGVA